MDDLELSFGDESSEISAADPNEILSRFEDIDELDAQLFGPKNVSKSPKDANLSKGKKKVSFQEPVKGDTVGKEKSKSQSDDWLFGGDDADDLLAEDPVVNKDNGEKSRVKSNIQSLMRPSTADDILKKSKPAVKKMTLDDFAVNPIAPKQEESTSPYTAVQSSKVSKKPEDEFDFGVYKPSLSKPSDSKRKETRRPSFGDDLSFLDDDFFPSTSKASPSQPVGRGKQKLTESDLSSTSSSGTMPGLDNPRPELSDLKVEPKSAKAGTQVAQSIDSKPQATPSRIDPGLASTPPLAAGRNLPRPRRSTDSSQPYAESDSNSVTPTNRLPSHSQKIFQTPKASVQRSFELNGASTNYNDAADLQTIKAQLEHTRALLHGVELGYKADLEVMRTAHDTQLEMLRSSFHDLKSRVDRDLDSVRESYSARIEVLRTAMNSQLESDTTKECEHQNEIKRLRNLHLQALEDSRLDMETRYDRLKQVHAAEIETIKSSMHDKRNIETMTAKVDESTGKLQQLSSKYESAYKAMTQHSESITLGNKQLISGFAEFCSISIITYPRQR